MLEIKCPYCGSRSQNEFSYGGDSNIKRPELGKEVSDKDWDNFIYLRKKFNVKHENKKLRIRKLGRSRWD